MGGIVRLGQCMLQTWSIIQAIVAMSSMEAEHQGLAVGAQEALQLKHIMSEVGLYIGVTIEFGASPSTAPWCSSCETPCPSSARREGTC